MLMPLISFFITLPCLEISRACENAPSYSNKRSYLIHSGQNSKGTGQEFAPAAIQRETGFAREQTSLKVRSEMQAGNSQSQIPQLARRLTNNRNSFVSP